MSSPSSHSLSRPPRPIPRNYHQKPRNASLRPQFLPDYLRVSPAQQSLHRLNTRSILTDVKVVDHPHLAPKEDVMAATQSEKREYKNEDYAKRQQKQWEKKGYKVTRRKNVLYLKKG